VVNTRCGCLTPCKAVKCHINSTNTNAQKCSQTCSAGQKLQAYGPIYTSKTLKILNCSSHTFDQIVINSYVRNLNRGSTQPFDSFSLVDCEKKKKLGTCKATVSQNPWSHMKTSLLSLFYFQFFFGLHSSWDIILS
jgi:hypothetical protein